MNTALLVAAGLALATWAIHTFIGGREIARPLLASSLAPVPKYTNYYCWHIVTIVLFAMAGGFAYAAFAPDGRDVAFLFTALSGAFMLWSIVLVVGKRRRPIELPQWVLFLAITIAATVGLT